jgi:hypothetical protein
MSNGSEEYKIHRKNEMLIKRKRIKIYTSVSQQTIGIPDGTNCAPLPIDLFFVIGITLNVMLGILKQKRRKASSVNFFSRSII